MLGSTKVSQEPPFLVYGKHNFVAEEEDEICFKVGEPLVVMEKDDAYEDGWWRGRNIDGHIGLFPMNFITFENIANFDVDSVEHLTLALRGINLDENDDSFTEPQPSEGRRPSVESIDDRRSVDERHGGQGQEGSGHPELWSIDDVADWLESAGFGSAAQKFVDHEITGDVLLDLNLSSLRELGVESLGDRINILHAILALKEDWANAPKEEAFTYDTIGRRPGPDAGKPKSKSQVPSQDSGYVDDDDERRRPMTEQEREVRQQRTVSYFTLSDYIDDMDTPQDGTDRLDTVREELESPVDDHNHHDFRSSGSSDLSDDGGILRPPTSPVSPSNPMHPSVTDAKKEEANGGLKGLARSFSRGKGERQARERKLEALKMNLSNPDYEGWLNVKIGSRAWKRRWCVLKEDVLYVIKAPDQPSQVRAMIPLTSGYKILPDSDFSKSRFSFMAKHARNKTVHFSAETQLAMVSWINVMVRAGQQKARAGPIPLIPIKNNDRLSRIPMSESHADSNNHSSHQRVSGGKPGVTSISAERGRNFPPAKYFPQGGRGVSGGGGGGGEEWRGTVGRRPLGPR
ncbi:polar growth protein [Rhizophlyctis rosea]|nr:polar growth protein [Rhizophlyctis rosea]